MVELNYYFLSGVACGFCICAIVVNRRLLFRTSKAVTGDSNFMKESSVSSDENIAVAVKENNSKRLTKKKIHEEYKMVLVVRSDLKMGKGKMGAQCAHAAVGAYAKSVTQNPTALRRWENDGQAKIAVRADSEDELMEIFNNAKKAGLVTALIRDAGRTQIAPNTKTVLGVGPASKSAIDAVTGHLKLCS